MPQNLLEAIWEALVNAKTAVTDVAGYRTLSELFLVLPPKADYPDYYMCENSEFCIKNEESCIKITQKRGILYEKR